MLCAETPSILYQLFFAYLQLIYPLGKDENHLRLGQLPVLHHH